MTRAGRNVLRIAAAIGVATLLPVVMRGAASQAPAEADVRRLLAGAIDIHVHSHPDNVARSLDGLEAASRPAPDGMRGIVLKNHYDPTAGLAYLARKDAPGLEVFGGIDLNLTVGGMNAAAVEHITQISGGWGRLVWMSTFDAENQVRYSKEKRPFVSVSRNGALLPETQAVIGVIAKHDLVLATGHVSATEGLMLLREGQRQGVRHMVVTHAMNPPILMNLAQMQEAAKLGRAHRVCRQHGCASGGKGAPRPLRGGDSTAGSAALPAVLRPGSAGKSAARRRLRRVSHGHAEARLL